MAGIFSTFSHKRNPKQIWGMDSKLETPNGWTPEGAIGYLPEGTVMGTKFDVTKNPLSPGLKSKGLTEDQWAAICEALRKAFGGTGISGDFSKAITKANDDYFTKIGCVACYAEYFKGCKAMVVYTKEEADSGKVTYMK